MLTDRYYYNHLSAQEKEIYAVLYKGVTELQKEIYHPSAVSQETVHRIFDAVTHDNPYLYYFNQTHLEFALSEYGIVLRPQYFCTQDQISTYNGRIQECVNQIVCDLDLLKCSELEKEKRVHDYMCKNISYDHDALHTSKVNRIVAAHSIIGVFAKQRAVCEGIAKATKLLLNTVDIGCIVVSGKASLFQRSEHAWNIVNINGEAYQLDVTWDMANSKKYGINYDYFNLTDVAMSKDHFDFQGVPLCNSETANYFTMNNLYFSDMRRLERHLIFGILRGHKKFYFKIADEGHRMSEIIAAVRNFVLAEITKYNVQAEVSASYNEEQRTGRILIKTVS